MNLRVWFFGKPVPSSFRVRAFASRTGTLLGERTYPVQGITIAGNLTHLLDSVIAVGTDLTFGPGGLGSPTLVISELSIGGS